MKPRSRSSASRAGSSPRKATPRRGLEEYRRKRAAEHTPEPFGGAAARPRLFVVQQHAARRLHWDFRLEWRGVLLSWAVPKGPCLDPAIKRLAVHVEDHPVDYADFEGVIPEGNYGAGAVIVWDRGRWTPLEDPDAGLESGKLLFALEGHKLRGRWTLVRAGGARSPDPRQWLLIKKADAFARAAPDDSLPDASVLSGLTLEELRSGSERIAALEARIAELGAPRRRVDAARLRPMLAQAREGPFSREGWLFEPKIDGYRVIAARRGERAQLFTRAGRDTTAAYPEIARAVAALPVDPLVLDGEIAVTDAEGRPRFAALQRRAQRARPRDVARASVESPVTYFVFDLLAWREHDLRPLPVLERKALLRSLLPRHGPLRFVEHFETRGEALYAELARRDIEGMVAKRADAPYRSGRSAHWQKIRVRRADDFVVVGFSAPRGSRSAFGALHLAHHRGGELVYVGRVGSGFSERQLREIRAALDGLERDTPPCTGPLPRTRGHHWVEPRLVCEVEFKEVTPDGLLRQPSFRGLREDKTPAECEAPPGPWGEAARAVGEDDEVPAPASPAPRAGEAAPPAPAAREVPFTNLDKVFWPAEGFTKGDLVDYYRTVGPWLLPYLADRPLVLTRYPDGISGKSFFQKDAPAWVPDWLRTERMWSEHASREISYFVCDDLESLLYVVNLGTIPLHVWSSRVASLQHPDWCILDLDPKGAPFAHVVRVARAIHALCEQMELPSCVKTSGSEGLHVLVPLGRQLTYAQSRSLAELIGRVVVQELPALATLARRLASRQGRVYVDTLQNGHGRLLVAPLCVRPLPGAPVSMPLEWEQVTARLRIGRHHLRSVPRQLRRWRRDPLEALLHEAPDLLRALARLGERLGGQG